MGRAARSARTPNWGDAERLVHAQGAFITALGPDLRMLEHYRKWFDGRDIPRLWRHWDTTQSTADMRACVAAMAGPASPAELDAIASLLRNELGIRFLREDPYPWGVDALVTLFQTAAHNDVAARIGVPMKVFVVELGGLSGLPLGRRARNECRDIERDSEWVYLNLVKHPTDSISALAEKWAEREKRVTDARSVVQNGIDRAIDRLGLAMARSGATK